MARVVLMGGICDARQCRLEMWLLGRRAGGAGARQVPGQRQDGRTHLLDIGGGYEADLAVCAAVIILELCLPPAAWV